jgi:hypothetical protein
MAHGATLIFESLDRSGAARADIANAIAIKVLRDADPQRSIGNLRSLPSRDRAIARRDDRHSR